MTKAMAEFYGDEFDSQGMPKPYSRYVISELRQEKLGANVRQVNIAAFDDEGLKYFPTGYSYIIKDKDPDEVIKDAYNKLCQHPELKKLKHKLSFN